jgi:hypothetical protein
MWMRVGVNIVACLDIGDAVRIVNSFYYQLIVHNYNHLFHYCAFTQFTSATHYASQSTYSSLHVFTTRESYKSHLIMHSKFSLHMYNTWSLLIHSVHLHRQTSCTLLWGSWPDIYCCLKVTVLLLRGALSDERTGLPFVRVIACISRSFVIM